MGEAALKPLPWGWVHAILQHYLELIASGSGKGSALEEVGGRMTWTASQLTLWISTVACKLERCPREPGATMSVVESLLYAESNAAELRNRIEEAERLVRRGGNYFSWIKPEVKRLRAQLEATEKKIAHLWRVGDGRGNSLNDLGMILLSYEFAACSADDPSFLRDVRGLR